MFIHPEVEELFKAETADLMRRGFSLKAAELVASVNVREYLQEETTHMLADIFGPTFDLYSGSVVPGMSFGPEDTDGVDVADEELDEPEDL